MDSNKLIQIVMVGVLIFLPASAGAQDVFTFAPPVGDTGFWRDPNNWSPAGGPPDAGDTAAIPNLKTCTVDDARQAQVVTVSSGGTLTIQDGGSLTVDLDLNGVPLAPLVTVSGTLNLEGTLSIDNSLGDIIGGPKLTLNGLLEFRKTGTATPTLLYGGGAGTFGLPFVIDGAGTIQALGQNGHVGLIDNLTNSDILEIESGVTLKGSLTIECDNGVTGQKGMKLDGTFLVDNAADVMRIGTLAPTERAYRTRGTLGM